MTASTNDGYRRLVDEALAEFWGVVARSFPEATTGDLSVDRDVALNMAATAAISEWVSNNVTAGPKLSDEGIS